MKTVGKMLLTLVAVLSIAATASAGDKLVVKDAAGTGHVFRVDDTGLTEAKGAWSTSDFTTINPVNGLPLGRQPVLGVYNSGVLRMNVNPSGITEWYLRSSTAESGAIKYSTPGGGVGFLLYHAGDTNRLDIGYFPTLGTGGTPVFHIGASGQPLGLAINRVGGTVGLGTLTPTQKLEVVGGVRLNPTAGTQPTCDANARGTFWFTQGTTDALQICAQTGTGLGWKAISLP